MLSKQIDVLGLDTADFYSNREKCLHELNHRVRAEKNRLLNGGDVYRCHGKKKVKVVGIREIERELCEYGIESCDVAAVLDGTYSISDDCDYTLILELCKEHKRLQELIDMKNKKAKETKDRLLTLLGNKVEDNIKSNSRHHIRTLRQDAVRDDKVISVFDSYFTRTIGAVPGEFTDDFMIVKVFYFDVLKDILFNGFMHDGERYVYFTSSAGQIRTKKCVFVKESTWNRVQRTIMCGLTVDDINDSGGVNPNKHLAYLALANSATDVWEEFDIDRAIVIDDFETEVEGYYDFVDDVSYTITRERGHKPITHTDGAGMMLPNAFGVEQRNKMVRLPWIKGLLGVFDFRKFIDYHYADPIIRDIYGKEHNVIEEDIQVIFTKSQFKMWNHYSSWEDYKEKYKRFNCSAGVTNEEEERIKNATINYQMLQSLTDITDDEILEIADGTITKLNRMCDSIGNIKNMFDITPYNMNKTDFQKCVELYPELLNDEWAKQHLKKIKNSVIKKAKAGKLDVHGKYTFILPDFYAACEYWFLGIPEPHGLLDDGEVFCWLFRRDAELDCLRSPHLFLEHAIRENVAYYEDDVRQHRVREWFVTDAVYTSCRDMISRILQFDVDGDKSLVVADKTLINVAKRNIEKYDIVPLYYDMKKAKPVHLDNKSIYDGLNAAFVGGNIGIYSNNISKIWNSDTFVNGSEEDKRRAIELIKVLCMENNFVIDYAKTLYKPTRPDDMNEEINSYTNQRLPHFFKYAKDKKDRQIIDANDSFINKLERMIPNPRINFKRLGIGDVDYRKLMHNQNIEFDLSFGRNGKIIENETDPLIVAYCNFDRKYYLAIDSSLSSNKVNVNESYARTKLKHRRIRDEIRDELSKFGYSEEEIVDVLVKYLYGNNRNNKSALWLCYGNIIYRNLVDNNMKKMTKDVRCIDCGEWFEVSIFDSATCRCEDCASRHKRELKRLEMQRYRQRKKDVGGTL